VHSAAQKCLVKYRWKGEILLSNFLVKKWKFGDKKPKCMSTHEFVNKFNTIILGNWFFTVPPKWVYMYWGAPSCEQSVHLHSSELLTWCGWHFTILQNTFTIIPFFQFTEQSIKLHTYIYIYIYIYIYTKYCSFTNTQQAIMLQNCDICTEKKHHQTLAPDLCCSYVYV